MRDIVRVSENGRLVEVEPIEFLWQLQWDRMSSGPGLPGWGLTKFLGDSVPWHRNRLCILFDIEARGRGIKYRRNASEGRFWSSKSFVRRHGFSFSFEHPDYTFDSLNTWFLLTTDGDWDDVFADLDADGAP